MIVVHSVAACCSSKSKQLLPNGSGLGLGGLLMQKSDLVCMCVKMKSVILFLVKLVVLNDDGD